MKRILLMVFRNLWFVPWAWCKLCYRASHTDKYTDIPRIFAREVLLSAGTYIINEEFTPSISSNSEILSGINTKEGIPDLKGYIGTSIKENATEILT